MQKYGYLDELAEVPDYFINIATQVLCILSTCALLFSSTGVVAGTFALVLSTLQIFLDLYIGAMKEAKWMSIESESNEGSELRNESMQDSQLKTIKEFSCEDKQELRFNEAMKKIEHSKGLFFSFTFWTSLASQLLGIVTFASTIVPLLWRISRDEISPAAAYVCITYIWGFKMSVQSLLGNSQSLRTSFAKISEALDLMDRESLILVDAGTPVDKPAVLGRVELCDVRFAYPSKPEKQVLHGVTIALEAGKSTALCGGSGGGKSSIVGLVLRDYDPQAQPRRPSLPSNRRACTADCQSE